MFKCDVIGCDEDAVAAENCTYTGKNGKIKVNILFCEKHSRCKTKTKCRMIADIFDKRIEGGVFVF